MSFEQRKYVRFSCKGDMFAALRDEFKKVGKVNDISIKGIGFSYLSEINQVDSDDHHTKVDIFSLENEFYLSNVPCKVIYEVADAAPDESDLVKMSKCGLHFEDLSKMQLDLLSFLIKKYTRKSKSMKKVPEMLDNHLELNKSNGIGHDIQKYEKD